MNAPLLRPMKSKEDAFLNVLMIGSIYIKYFWPKILVILNDRKKAMPSNPKKFFALTESVIVLYFSYVECTAKSFHAVIQDGVKKGILTALSNKQMALISKKSEILTFEELMKIQFSILPKAFGLESNYGEIKTKNLNLLYAMRDVRNKIVHPSSIEDTFYDPFSELSGKDIIAPIL